MDIGSSPTIPVILGLVSHWPPEIAIDVVVMGMTEAPLATGVELTQFVNVCVYYMIDIAYYYHIYIFL